MIVNFQGFGHFVDGLNNQDAAIETDRMVLVLDGCSGARFAEVGTRLFAQLFARKEDYDKLENFELNMKETFEEILNKIRGHYTSDEDFEKNFIMDNLLFTTIALFDCGEKYVVKMFGDGYIITQNVYGNISYMRFSYGKYPPYFAYKYCKGMGLENREFKTYELKKSSFPRVFIGTDGIQPVVKGEVDGFDDIIKRNDKQIQSVIRSNRQKFYDDITIGRFGN